MSRRGSQRKDSYRFDPVYQSILVNIFVNRVIRHGKKSLAYRIVYSAFRRIQDKTGKEPLAIVEHAVRVLIPTVQLKTRRVGGATYQVPIEVLPRDGIVMAIQWILAASRVRVRRGISRRLSLEILDVIFGNGGALRKREEIHRLAEVNKAFTRYRFLF
jgi:small subunit ribosomal protein S7